jgi:hypothetical protein
MFKRIASTALIVLLAGALSSCIFDPDEKKKDDGGGGETVYPELTTREAVLKTIELAYDDRNAPAYESIFDPDNFTFFFNPGDVASGETPEQWGFDEERQSANNMFSGAGGQNNNPILSIDLTLDGIDTATWTEVSDDRFPGESLWSATINYTYYIDTEADIQFITQGAPKAQFILRQVGDQWRLVTWYDLEGS